MRCGRGWRGSCSAARGLISWRDRCRAASGSARCWPRCCSPTPPPQLLLLDEPTNNLDMASARQLAQALACYRGALIVVSHDVPFLRSIGITRWLRLDRDGRLADAGPPSPPGGPAPVTPHG